VASISVGIFGCGWLGRALAKRLQLHYKVYGAVRSVDSLQKLEKEKITAFKLPAKDSEFWNVETLVVAISPRQEYLKTMQQISENVKARTQQFILLSTTSVYQDDDLLITETSAVDSSKLAVEGENLFKSYWPKGTVIRLAGLMGADRIAGQWGASVVTNTSVNYVHQVDAVEIISEVIKQNIHGEIINAVAPQHPKRALIYKMNCDRFGWKIPSFMEGEEKIIAGRKSEILLRYDYKFQDPMHFWSDN